MSIHTLPIVTCIFALLLATGWLFAGRLMLKRWHVEPCVAALLVGRRIGAVYLGVGPAILVYVAVEVLLLPGFGTLLLAPGVGRA